MSTEREWGFEVNGEQQRGWSCAVACDRLRVELELGTLRIGDAVAEKPNEMMRFEILYRSRAFLIEFKRV